ncbi:complement factor B-like [Dicentrarchus labrax]|uniref:complement factor B-like n=1 Tax=Dicentrarchus labrax TaxID=13489 RepID=UPI0021F60357|nr:complement factor B-like [Dicentrarchus labrax]
MGFSVHWSRLAALLCLLCMGGGVWCDCTVASVQIEGGDYKLTKKLEPGSLLIYNCSKGFYPYPALTRLCQPNGTWKPAPKRFQPQRCRIVECPDPNVLENGDVSPPQERYFVDNETSYECYSGYTLRGSSTRVCLPNGKWSGSTPICSHDTGDNCADPGIPPGASRTGNIFGIDDTVEYSCNNNLFLVGSRERVCQENGQWTGREPACYYKHTYDTSLEVSKEFGSTIKNTLTTIQPVNDTQEGRTIRIPKNGTLNMFIAVDISESIEEKDIQDAKNAVKQLISKISSFSVNPNYEIIFFSSVVVEVVNILDFFDGKQENILNKLDGFEKGDASGTNLNIVFETFLEQMGLIKRRVGEEAFKEHRHAIIVFTDGAYNMGGSPASTVKQIKNMVYMNPTSEEEKQPRGEYLDIYVFAIGAEIDDGELQPLTAGTGGKHYFRLEDIENLQETFDAIIDEEEVKGLCGLHVEYDTTERDAKQKMYPWMAFVVIQNEDPRKCIGSLVSREFILTAAHCLKFGDLPEHVRIEIDDGQGRVKKVKTFMRHPKYNVTAKVDKKVKEFYDYDVALIQLEKPVQISTSVRPICIPCTVETRNALQLVPDSTCKQQEQLLLKDHLERLTFLTRTENIVDEKDVHAKLGTNRAGCIKHALQAPGIDTDVITDVVTDNFLCTGGRTPFRDHIACTGDSGGAVFKNYEHRTIQVAVVSWGTKTLCRTGGVVESDDTSRDFHINLFRVVPFLKSILGNNDQDDYAPLTFLES